MKKYMVADDATKFLGFSYEISEFDEYLTSIGILERPDWKISPMATCRNVEDGFSFLFGSKATYEKYFGATVGGGNMIFEGFGMYSSKNLDGMKGYTQALPFGLTFGMRLEEIQALLGKQNMDQPSGSSNTTYSWFNHKKMAISICFLPDNNGISHVLVEKAQLRDL
jgi:hypothetical protein